MTPTGTLEALIFVRDSSDRISSNPFHLFHTLCPFLLFLFRAVLFEISRTQHPPIKEENEWNWKKRKDRMKLNVSKKESRNLGINRSVLAIGILFGEQIVQACRKTSTCSPDRILWSNLGRWMNRFEKDRTDPTFIDWQNFLKKIHRQLYYIIIVYSSQFENRLKSYHPVLRKIRNIKNDHQKIEYRANQWILLTSKKCSTISNLVRLSIRFWLPNTWYKIARFESISLVNFIDNPSPSVPIQDSRRSIEFPRWLNLNGRKGGRCALLTSVKRRFKQSNFQIAWAGRRPLGGKI